MLGLWVARLQIIKSRLTRRHNLMPLPIPSADESEKDFVSRFMGDEDMIAEYPDESQRSAVAYSTFADDETEMASVSILEVGEAKGHDLFVDAVSLSKALDLMKLAKNGTKVKMNHGSGLEAVVGFARNPRIENNKLVADLRLLKSSPHYDLIKEMASEAPDQFGVSLAFVNESETIDGKDYIRPQSIASADLVSSPAATNGLFEEMVKFMEKLGYVSGGGTIPAVVKKAVVEAPLDKKDKTNMDDQYMKDIEDIKVRLGAIEAAMKPEEQKKLAVVDPMDDKAVAEGAKAEGESVDEEKKEEAMSEVVKKVLTEFGIKPIPASPSIEVPSEKKDEPKNFEALVAAHSDYGTSKLKAMKAVMLSNPKEYTEALTRGIFKL